MPLHCHISFFKQTITLFQRFTRLEYAYDLIAGHVNRLSYKKGSQDEFYFHYEYDGGNRLREAWSSLNETFWDLDARYRYCLHGPQVRVELGRACSYIRQGYLLRICENGILRLRTAAVNRHPRIFR